MPAHTPAQHNQLPESNHQPAVLANFAVRGVAMTRHESTLVRFERQHTATGRTCPRVCHPKELANCTVGNALKLLATSFVDRT